MFKLTSRWVNLALLVNTLSLLASGIILFTTSRIQDSWVYQVHRYAGMLLAVLLIPKTTIIFSSLARQWKIGSWWNLATLAAVILTVALVGSIAFAIVWTLNLVPFYFTFILDTTPLAAHWYLALGLVPLFGWHVLARWKRVAPRRQIVSFPASNFRRTRREALRLFGFAAFGLVSFIALDQLSTLTGWARRFTGSRFVDSFDAISFPVTSSEAPPAFDVTAWRLRVYGRVTRPLELTYKDLLSFADSSYSATVDCTLGWASTQVWRGVSIAQLLENAGVSEGAHELTCRGVTGYVSTLSIEEGREALIATHVGDQPLSQAHGFPARLVAPTRRGYNWIKWMNELVVS